MTNKVSGSEYPEQGRTPNNLKIENWNSVFGITYTTSADDSKQYEEELDSR